MNFDYAADRRFFRRLLCQPGEGLKGYADLFDFRSAQQKRREYAVLRARTLRDLKARFGSACLLRCAPDCSVKSGLTVDHLIPLSSNDLNKCLRGMKATRRATGRWAKAPTQNFGSNRERNLVLSCVNCNSFKKHHLPSANCVKAALTRLQMTGPR